MREIGAIAALTRSGWLTASCTENSEIGRRLWAPRLRGVSAGSHHSWRRIVKARRRSSGSDLGVDDLADVVERTRAWSPRTARGAARPCRRSTGRSRAATASSGRSTSWIVNSVVPFSSISSNAASRKRWTRCSARERAAFRLRETARWRQAGSFASPGDVDFRHSGIRFHSCHGISVAFARDALRHGSARSPLSARAPRPRPSARRPSTAARTRRWRRPRARGCTREPPR